MDPWCSARGPWAAGTSSRHGGTRTRLPTRRKARFVARRRLAPRTGPLRSLNGVSMGITVKPQPATGATRGGAVLKAELELLGFTTSVCVRRQAWAGLDKTASVLRWMGSRFAQYLIREAALDRLETESRQRPMNTNVVTAGRHQDPSRQAHPSSLQPLES